MCRETVAKQMETDQPGNKSERYKDLSAPECYSNDTNYMLVLFGCQGIGSRLAMEFWRNKGRGSIREHLIESLKDLVLQTYLYCDLVTPLYCRGETKSPKTV